MIRELTRDDLAKLNELHSRGMSVTREEDIRGRRVYEELYPQIFLDHPWSDGRSHCLVADDSEGRLIGALGVMNRPFVIHERPVTAAISAELFVDPSSRAGLCGIQLLKSFLNGPQDFSVADVANEKTRQIWTRLGGRVLPLYGLTWMAVLSPCRFGVSLALKGSTAGRLVSPLAGFADHAARRLIQAESTVDVSSLESEPLTPELMAEHAADLMQHHDLRPEYDNVGTKWLWNRLNFVAPGAGPSRQTLVRDAKGTPLGWYIYQWKPGRIARVSQLVARRSAEPRVLGHLLRTLKLANISGAVGRMQPEFLESMSDSGCLFRRRSRHVLVHSKNRDLNSAFESRRAFLSMIDGEGAIQLWNDPMDALRSMLPGRIPDVSVVGR